MTTFSYPVEHLMFITPRPEIVFTQGQGMWITDHTGKSYLDFLQGWAVNSFGHSPEFITNALTCQAKKLIHPSAAFYNEPAIALAKKLTETSDFDRVFFTSSGAEANEGAIKLARKWGSKHPHSTGQARFEIITFHNSFHGRTLACMAASGKAGWDSLFDPKVPGFPKANLHDLDSVKKCITPKTVAIMLEPVQGEGGVLPVAPEFLQALRALATEHNLLLIVDEVQTGVGRCGTLFAYQQAQISPDIMTLGKGIGGGVPLAALLATEAVACFDAGDQGGTYTGNPLMTAVGLAVMEAVTAPGFLENLQKTAAYLAEKLTAFSAQHGLRGERGQGLLRALMLDTQKSAALVEAARHLSPTGLLLNAPRPDVLRFMPALNVTRDEIDRMLELLAHAFAAVG